MNIQSKSRALAVAFGIAGLVAIGAAVAGPHGHGGRDRGFAFDRADANGDGKVTLAEADAVKAERMAGMDANDDGYVTFEEAKAHRQALREERARARFAQLDTNGDGKVSVAEAEAPADAHAEKLFARFDSNGDGAIAADELPQRRMRSEREERRDANR